MRRTTRLGVLRLLSFVLNSQVRRQCVDVSACLGEEVPSLEAIVGPGVGVDWFLVCLYCSLRSNGGVCTRCLQLAAVIRLRPVRLVHIAWQPLFADVH